MKYDSVLSMFKVYVIITIKFSAHAKFLDSQMNICA